MGYVPMTFTHRLLFWPNGTPKSTRYQSTQDTPSRSGGGSQFRVISPCPVTRPTRFTGALVKVVNRFLGRPGGGRPAAEEDVAGAHLDLVLLAGGEARPRDGVGEGAGGGAVDRHPTAGGKLLVAHVVAGDAVAGVRRRGPGQVDGRAGRRGCREAGGRAGGVVEGNRIGVGPAGTDFAAVDNDSRSYAVLIGCPPRLAYVVDKGRGRVGAVGAGGRILAGVPRAGLPWTLR